LNNLLSKKSCLNEIDKLNEESDFSEVGFLDSSHQEISELSIDFKEKPSG